MTNINIAGQVSRIIARVKHEGDSALILYTLKFDGVKLSVSQLRVPKAEFGNARKNVEPLLRVALEKAASNISRFHRDERKRLLKSWRADYGGLKTGQIFTPIEKIGIYVPGGRFSYPSTVLMSAIPARVAGVSRVVMVTPPHRISPALLYAAELGGVDEVYRVGGSQAVAALAYGTKTVPCVDLIVGPGNAYVNEAKRQVFGAVGIDALAGPSEVAIVADRHARTDVIVADIMAQVEHDPGARACLLSDSGSLLNRVKQAIPGDALAQVTFIRCSLSGAASLINDRAPEHLEVMLAKPQQFVPRVKNAGAIFANYDTPTAIGDYWAGPSHVLPTGRTARFSSGLSVASFLKRTSYIEYSAAALSREGKYIEAFAVSEGLKNHRHSVAVRKNKRGIYES